MKTIRLDKRVPEPLVRQAIKLRGRLARARRCLERLNRALDRCACHDDEDEPHAASETDAG